jgi:DNA repair protein RadC
VFNYEEESSLRGQNRSIKIASIRSHRKRSKQIVVYLKKIDIKSILSTLIALKALIVLILMQKYEICFANLVLSKKNTIFAAQTYAEGCLTSLAEGSRHIKKAFIDVWF